MKFQQRLNKQKNSHEKWQWLKVLLKNPLTIQQGVLTNSPRHHFETVPNSKKLQTTTQMWLLKDFKIQIA